MSCNANTPNVNKTFIIEPLSITGGSPTLSGCSGVFTNQLISCSGNTIISLGTGIITMNSDLSANTINGSVFLSGGTNLLDIFSTTDYYVTGTTFVNNNLTLYRNDGVNFSVLIDNFSGITVDTLSANTIITDVLSASTIYGISEVTGFTYDNANTFTIQRNDGITLSANFSIITGITTTGDIVPDIDNTIILGTPLKRFRELNAYSGNTTVWLATQKVITPQLELGLDSSGNTRTITADNSVIQDDCLLGGTY